MNGPVESAGLLLYRFRDGAVEVLLAHPGGPFWARRDLGSWSVPKGEVDPGEDLRSAALREFTEETGSAPPPGELLGLGSVRQAAGKVVHAWAVPGDFDPESLASNSFTAEWPPRSGRTVEFPEIDRVAWFAPEVAREKLNPAQAAFVDRLLAVLASGRPDFGAPGI
jgi:predicted NUDIX family NTP pyrophosphohydrolase